MAAQYRFKIDLNEYCTNFPYALFRLKVRTGLFGREAREWKFISSFETQAEARAFYETIKDLPEYLA
jgi:hypothetical protein